MTRIMAILVDWKPAPASSHVDAFRLESDEGEKLIFIDIRYKATRTRPESGYRYTFTDTQEAFTLWEVIQEMDHPGELVWDELKRKGVPYERIF